MLVKIVILIIITVINKEINIEKLYRNRSQASIHHFYLYIYDKIHTAKGSVCTKVRE